MDTPGIYFCMGVPSVSENKKVGHVGILPGHGNYGDFGKMTKNGLTEEIPKKRREL